MQNPFRHCEDCVQVCPLLSRQAVPAALQVVVAGSAHPLPGPPSNGGEQVVAQAVVLPQARPFAQGACVPAAQLPLPSQEEGVSIPLAQAA